MHATNPHRARPTNRDPPRPPGEEAGGAAATAPQDPDGTEGFESRRDGVDDETEVVTMTHGTDPAFDDGHGDATASGATGVTSR